ncbi:CAP domain-containing protein [Demequina sp. NBRC 110057]|uniref:CAP domain-containing protein n=1 Tax=Demequina sp. NBRC 110057 TaxID=1570346 RepID=UPI0009FD4548|nr:CAP domain-containing protein [Demequina sp. NBRC 110057]
MTETQDVLAPTRPRRSAAAIVLLGMIPLAVAGTAGVAAATWLPGEQPGPVVVSKTDHLDGTPAPDITSALVAPGSLKDVDLAASVQAIKVTVPEPVETKPAVTVTAQQTTKAATATPDKKARAGNEATTKKATTKKPSSPQKSSQSTEAAQKTSSSGSGKTFQQYCSSPQSPAAASGGAKGLMAAANKERARLGIAPLSWNGSLASAATSWSTSMAQKDSGTSAPMDALAHNPNRPGAENVAVSHASGGMGEGSAVSRAHSGWMYSNGHCLNLMNPAYTQMGAGTAKTSDGTTWYTTANYR